jgi:hypothetical protein
MNKVLILYPAEFKSQSKFDRKVGHITSNMTDYCLISPHDSNNLISNFVQICPTKVEHIHADPWDSIGVTHAIVFDDGEAFPDEIVKIESKNIPLRIIKIQITRVNI